ncbi:RNA 2',3'-cyclic phosphodiesterase [Antarcticirhabdus aurantiaca]|uniref:RNA 2',3'-cyclic phosphodiesterase n=1 Tax=Antarcticirhabdus aurantiaca TaxID=2606717 RepID=A0ACD4NQT8_9HYPH|nr:RNA 2',3'-cyclic phosphodiesterase [Antarcticirhabdus aurantiaca]WAJ29072.1 RNA 2',3'-cyclic phosphodiesterase [Jeongeuplla avenae]
MPRLFVALEIPRDAALSLSFLRGGLASARWIDAENYHLTLRFIGDVEARLADEVVASLDRIVRAPFQIALKGVGSFGTKKPHSVYAGVEASPELEALQAEADRAVRRPGLPADPRRFTPHVTLARLRNPKDAEVARYLDGRANFRTPPFKVDRFVLYSSRESVGGGPYVIEEAFRLSGTPARTGGAPIQAGAHLAPR